jgi:Holliday junction resolvase RusA-like endonuclease
MAFKTIIKIEPVAKGRPRSTIQGGKIWTYNPDRTQVAEETIRAFLSEYKETIFPQHAPLKLTVTFYRTKSKWLPKRETLPFRRPDLDNLLKLLLDAINHILIPDDAQITSIETKKRWSTKSYGYIELTLENDCF